MTYVTMFQKQADFDDDWEEVVAVAAFDNQDAAQALADALENEEAMRAAWVVELPLNPTNIDELVAEYNPPVEDDEDEED